MTNVPPDTSVVPTKCWFCFDPIKDDDGFVQISPCKCTICNYCFIMHLLKTNSEPHFECSRCYIPINSIEICKYDSFHKTKSWNTFTVTPVTNKMNRYYGMIEKNEKSSTNKTSSLSERNLSPKKLAAATQSKPSSLDKKNDKNENENKTSNVAASNNNDNDNDGDNTCNEKTPVKRKQCTALESDSKRKKTSTPKIDEDEKLTKTTDDYIAEMKAFKKKFGHFTVNFDENPNLALFGCHIRNGHCKITKEQQKRLKRIGFPLMDEKDIDNIIIDNNKRRVKSFEEWFKELEKFKAEYGHCIVPNTQCIRETYPGLSDWVGRIRNGRSTGKYITNEQRDVLNRIGFYWEKKSVRDDRDWNVQYEKLIKFKKRFGHAKLPYLWKEDKKLYMWTHTQRKRNNKNKLRPDRKDLLNSIGFHWGNNSSNSNNNNESDNESDDDENNNSNENDF